MRAFVFDFCHNIGGEKNSAYLYSEMRLMGNMVVHEH